MKRTAMASVAVLVAGTLNADAEVTLVGGSSDPGNWLIRAAGPKYSALQIHDRIGQTNHTWSWEILIGYNNGQPVYASKSAEIKYNRTLRITGVDERCLPVASSKKKGWGSSATNTFKVELLFTQLWVSDDPLPDPLAQGTQGLPTVPELVTGTTTLSVTASIDSDGNVSFDPYANVPEGTVEASDETFKITFATNGVNAPKIKVITAGTLDGFTCGEETHIFDAPFEIGRFTSVEVANSCS